MHVARTRPPGHPHRAELVPGRDAAAGFEPVADRVEVGEVVAHAVVTEDRDRLAAARRRVVDRGVPVVDTADLEQCAVDR